MVRSSKFIFALMAIECAALDVSRTATCQETQRPGPQSVRFDPESVAQRPKADDWVERPWLMKAPAFAIAENLYYVGNRHFSSHLLVGQNEVVLIDTPYKEHAYLLTESIRAVGVDPADITLILHTHYHYDHVGATRRIQELSGAKVAMGQDDIPLLKSKMPDYGEPFEVDLALEHGDAIDIGGTVIHCHNSRGHTPGSMSFTFDVVIDGQRHTAVLFGGPGTGFLARKELRSYDNAVEDFAQTVEYMSTVEADVILGSHPFVNDTLGKHERLVKGEKPNPFIDLKGWQRYLNNARNKAQKAVVEQRAGSEKASP